MDASTPSSMLVSALLPSGLDTNSLCHLLDVISYALSLVFLSSGPSVNVYIYI